MIIIFGDCGKLSELSTNFKHGHSYKLELSTHCSYIKGGDNSQLYENL